MTPRTVPAYMVANRILVGGVLVVLVSACGVRHYRLQVAGRSDLLTPPKRSGEAVSSREGASAWDNAGGRIECDGLVDLLLRRRTSSQPPARSICASSKENAKSRESFVGFRRRTGKLP